MCNSNPYILKKFAVDIFDMKGKDRKLLQDFGTKMKEIDKCIWIKSLDKKIKDISDNIVIDDLRFKDEENYLRSIGFKILKLDIDNDLQNNRLKTTYNNGRYFDVFWNTIKPGSGTTDLINYGEGGLGGFTFSSYNVNSINKQLPPIDLLEITPNDVIVGGVSLKNVILNIKNYKK
jgi:hypothetical protein